MIVKCQQCGIDFDDEFRWTICPHETFAANDWKNNFAHHPESVGPALAFMKAFLAPEFESGKKYLCFVKDGTVEAEALQSIDIDADVTFVFAFTGSEPVYNCVRVCEIKEGITIFVDARYVVESALVGVPGVKMIDTNGRLLKDVIIGWGKDTQEECAKIAERAMEGDGPWGRSTLEEVARLIRSGK